MAQRITQTFTFATGSTGFWGFDLDNGVPGAMLFEPASPTAPQPSLINFGQMNYAPPIVPVNSTAFIWFSTTSQWELATIENHGDIYAQTSNVDQVFAIRALSSSPNLVNSGLVFASARKSAIAFESWDSTLTITNSGAISAVAPEEAIAIHTPNGANITTGNVSAWANGGPGISTRAIGIYVSQNGNHTVIRNSLVIEARDFDPSANNAYGIRYVGNLVDLIVNDGIIRGDYAIFEENNGGPTGLAAVTVRNNNLLEGRVFLGDGNDVLENNGTIQGNVDLGAQNDVYNGQLGSVIGDISGDDGNDQLFGGAGPDTIFGGGGDDWIEGGAGADQIFGGNGANDVVAYGSSLSAVNADLQSFAFSGGDATGDTYSGIEGVSGSGFNDTLSGDTNANRLFGQGGVDSLAGRGGNDYLDTGAGNDTLVFADNGGVDTVTDFDDFGDDVIQLSISGITSFAQVQAVMTQSGADVFIDFATTDIVLVNTTLASMGADDFTFV
jgi:Ca2+-binding RTX toxin-like protein